MNQTLAAAEKLKTKSTVAHFPVSAPHPAPDSLLPAAAHGSLQRPVVSPDFSVVAKAASTSRSSAAVSAPLRPAASGTSVSSSATDAREWLSFAVRAQRSNSQLANVSGCPPSRISVRTSVDLFVQDILPASAPTRAPLNLLDAAPTAAVAAGIGSGIKSLTSLVRFGLSKATGASSSSKVTPIPDIVANAAAITSPHPVAAVKPIVAPYTSKAVSSEGGVINVSTASSCAHPFGIRRRLAVAAAGASFNSAHLVDATFCWKRSETGDVGHIFSSPMNVLMSSVFNTTDEDSTAEGESTSMPPADAAVAAGAIEHATLLTQADAIVPFAHPSKPENHEVVPLEKVAGLTSVVMSGFKRASRIVRSAIIDQLDQHTLDSNACADDVGTMTQSTSGAINSGTPISTATLPTDLAAEVGWEFLRQRRNGMATLRVSGPHGVPVTCTSSDRGTVLLFSHNPAPFVATFSSSSAPCVSSHDILLSAAALQKQLARVASLGAPLSSSARAALSEWVAQLCAAQNAWSVSVDKGSAPPSGMTTPTAIVSPSAAELHAARWLLHIHVAELIRFAALSRDAASALRSSVSDAEHERALHSAIVDTVDMLCLDVIAASCAHAGLWRSVWFCVKLAYSRPAARSGSGASFAHYVKVLERALQNNDNVSVQHVLPTCDAVFKRLLSLPDTESSSAHLQALASAYFPPDVVGAAPLELTSPSADALVFRPNMAPNMTEQVWHDLALLGYLPALPRVSGAQLNSMNGDALPASLLIGAQARLRGDEKFVAPVPPVCLMLHHFLALLRTSPQHLCLLMSSFGYAFPVPFVLDACMLASNFRSVMASIASEAIAFVGFCITSAPTCQVLGPGGCSQPLRPLIRASQFSSQGRDFLRVYFKLLTGAPLLPGQVRPAIEHTRPNVLA
ncbi:MAG: hypothetical protein EOO65_01995, partial [Methanosarcinales archaeon]